MLSSLALRNASSFFRRFVQLIFFHLSHNTLQNFQGNSDLFAKCPSIRITEDFIFSKSLTSSLTCKSNFLGEKYFLSVDRRFCLGSPGFDFLHLLLSGFPDGWNIPHSSFLIHHILYCVWMSWDSHYLNFSTFSSIPLRLPSSTSLSVLPAVLSVSEPVAQSHLHISQFDYTSRFLKSLKRLTASLLKYSPFMSYNLLINLLCASWHIWSVGSALIGPVYMDEFLLTIHEASTRFFIYFHRKN